MSPKFIGNQIIVSDVYVKDDKSEYECLAAINNFSSLRKRIAVGESLSSNDFVMLFPNSLGESKWKLLFYPNGQYVEEQVGRYAGIYLVMQSCEKDVALTANVAFQLKSESQNDGPVTNLNANFVYSIPSQRWIGEPNFIGKNYLNSKRCEHFFANDTLIINCAIEETYPKTVPKTEEPTGIDNQLSKTCERRINHQKGATSSTSPFLDDFKNSNVGGWIKVDYGKGKKKHPKNVANQGNIDTSKPKSSVYRNYAVEILSCNFNSIFRSPTKAKE